MSTMTLPMPMIATRRPISKVCSLNGGSEL